MARRKSVAELEELLKIKRAQAEAKKAHKSANPTAYKPKPDEDYDSTYYLDPLDNSRFLKVRVSKKTIELFGGLTAASLSATATAGHAVVDIGKGSKIAIVKVRWYFGDETPIAVPANEYHGRWIKFYDAKNGQAFHQIPFTATGLTPNLHAVIQAFRDKLNTDGEKARILGANTFSLFILMFPSASHQRFIYQCHLM